MADRYDSIVIGSGPAGLSAAITLKIRNKNVLVLGSPKGSAKVEKAHEIQNYLGIPAVKGSDLAEKFLQHAKSMEVEMADEQVVTVYAMGEYFAISTRSNTMYEAKTVILATGVSFGKPYPGEEQFLGRGVSYCATCDAPLYRGKKVLIIGSSPKEEAEAAFMAELAAEVFYVPMYAEKTRFEKEMSDWVTDEGLAKKGDGKEAKDHEAAEMKVKVIREKPLEIKGAFKADTLLLEQQEIKADGIFILRDSVSPAQLVPGLAVENNHVTVNRKMETSIEGCFACGDLVGRPYQYIKAAGEGNIAAISAVEYLGKER